MRRRTCTALLAATAALAAGSYVGVAGPAGADDRGSEPYEVGLVGDMPYADYGRALYPGVIADVNRAKVAFSIFDGDTKNGSEPCYADPHPATGIAGTTGTPENAVATAPFTDAAHYALGQDGYKYAQSLFARYDRPLIYTPGDNEWTDCDRDPAKLTTPNQSDSVDRLNYLRALSYPTDQSLGRRTLTVARQPSYPENARWSKGPVTYVTLNVTGSDNNWVDDTASAQAKNGPAAEAQAEYTARNAANLQWLKDAFAAAKADHAKGVMITMQADMWDPTAVQTHFADTKAELVRQVTAFSGPVVLVNGDSHSFEVDKPLTDYATVNAAGAAGPNVIENFTRVTTFGEYQYHWVSATVDPRDPQVFSFHQHIVTQDVPAYTQPPAGTQASVG